MYKSIFFFFLLQQQYTVNVNYIFELEQFYSVHIFPASGGCYYLFFKVNDLLLLNTQYILRDNSKKNNKKNILYISKFVNIIEIFAQ